MLVLVCCFMYYCVVAPCVSVLFDVFHLGKWGVRGGGGGGGAREDGCLVILGVLLQCMSVCR